MAEDRCGGSSQQGAQLLAQRRLQLAGFDQPFAVDALFQGIQDGVGGLHAQVGLDQQRFQVIPGVRGDIGGPQQGCDLPEGSFAGLRQPVFPF